MTALDWSSDGAHWPHRQASRFVDAGGCRWHVQVHPGGAAQPVVWLLHGTGAAGHSWRGLVPLLAQRATLAVPDLPGRGFSGPLPGCTLVSMARALAALAGTLGLPPSVLVGHSAGAALAVRATLDLGGARLGLDAHGDIGGACRRTQRIGRAGVHLGGQGGAVGVVRGQQGGQERFGHRGGRGRCAPDRRAPAHASDGPAPRPGCPGCRVKLTRWKAPAAGGSSSAPVLPKVR